MIHVYEQRHAALDAIFRDMTAIADTVDEHYEAKRVQYLALNSRLEETYQRLVSFTSAIHAAHTERPH